ncbi:hypothetical protein [Streptomyces sp. NPDC017991]
MPTKATMFSVGLFSGPIVRLIGPKSVVVIGNLISALAVAMLAFAHRQVR